MKLQKKRKKGHILLIFPVLGKMTHMCITKANDKSHGHIHACSHGLGMPMAVCTGTSTIGKHAARVHKQCLSFVACSAKLSRWGHESIQSIVVQQICPKLSMAAGCQCTSDPNKVDFLDVTLVCVKNTHWQWLKVVVTNLLTYGHVPSTLSFRCFNLFIFMKWSGTLLNGLHLLFKTRWFCCHV